MPHQRQLANFGGTLRFRPSHYFAPRSARELRRLIATLDSTQRIRAIGALHSWSDAARGDDVVLDLKHFKNVRAAHDGTAMIDAGARIHEALAALRPHGLTLPTLGAVGAQTVAGAIATATHGSGKSSLSHYVVELRILTFDEHGKPVVRRIVEGQGLEAARCALGRMGIVLRARIRCTSLHCLAEVTDRDARPLCDLVTVEQPDATQCYLIPWAWTWVLQRRARVDAPPAGKLAVLRYRIKRFVLQTLGVDVVTWLFARILGQPRPLRRIYPRLFKMLKRMSIVADSERVLLSSHRLRYAEAEVFVPVKRVAEAAALIEDILRYVGDDAAPLSGAARDLVAEAGEIDSLEALRGRYVHHYPITFRRVQRDDTLISMTSDEDRYAISLISFSRPATAHFAAFEAVVRLLAHTMEAPFRARWHWGKLLPFEQPYAGAPAKLNEFAAECDALDPQRRFRSEFSERWLGV